MKMKKLAQSHLLAEPLSKMDTKEIVMDKVQFVYETYISTTQKSCGMR